MIDLGSLIRHILLDSCFKDIVQFKLIVREFVVKSLYGTTVYHRRSVFMLLYTTHWHWEVDKLFSVFRHDLRVNHALGIGPSWLLMVLLVAMFIIWWSEILFVSPCCLWTSHIAWFGVLAMLWLLLSVIGLLVASGQVFMQISCVKDLRRSRSTIGGSISSCSFCSWFMFLHIFHLLCYRLFKSFIKLRPDS